METNKFLNLLPLLFSCENGSKLRRVWLQHAIQKKKRGRRKCVVQTPFSWRVARTYYVSRRKMAPFPPWQKCNQNYLVESQALLRELTRRSSPNGAKSKKTYSSIMAEDFRRQLSSQPCVCYASISGSALNSCFLLSWCFLGGNTHQFPAKRDTRDRR